MNIKQITKLFKSNNIIYHFLFPYTSQKLLGPSTTKFLDILYFDLIKELKISSLVECGAYEASASLEAIKRGCKAYAIEANPNTFNKITPKSNDKLISMNIGLSDKAGYLDFYFPKKNNTEISSTFIKKEDTKYNCVKVPTQTLDFLISKFNIDKEPFSLWIDVEGFQNQVLLGAIKTLSKKNCKLIKIEVENVEKFKGQLFLSGEIEKFLKKFDFIPISRDFEYDYQFNVIFVKKNYLSKIDKLALESIKQSVFNSINLKKILFLIKNINILKSEIKFLVINIFGKKTGNFIAKLFGSKSSKAYVDRGDFKN
jgi:FkbM family methyltransferase